MDPGPRTFELPPPPTNRCGYADEFYKWASQLCSKAIEEKKPIAVKTAKLYLLEKYMDFRLAAPANHRNNLGSNKHVCLYSVFIEIYERLQKAELELPLSPLVPPAPPKREQQMLGVFFGEVEQEK